MARTSYAIALGSNRRSRHGSPEATLRAALAAIQGVRAVSKIRATPALGPGGRSFANAAAIVETELEPGRAARRAQGDRARASAAAPAAAGGRACSISTSSSGPAGPGTVPARSSPIRPSVNATFVLQPLAEIAPDWRDPITGATVRQLLARLTAPRPERR